MDRLEEMEIFEEMEEFGDFLDFDETDEIQESYSDRYTEAYRCIVETGADCVF